MEVPVAAGIHFVVAGIPDSVAEIFLNLTWVFAGAVAGQILADLAPHCSAQQIDRLTVVVAAGGWPF